MTWRNGNITPDPIRIEKYKDTNIRYLKDNLNQKNDIIVELEGDISKKYDDISNFKRDINYLKH